MIKKIKSLIMRHGTSFLAFTIANILAAINFNLLLKPINLVAGGASGLSLVLEKIFHISTSHLITIIYIITFILSLFFLKKKTVIGIIYASIIYPIFIYLTEDITSLIVLNYNDTFLVCVISGVISGLTNGFAFRYNLSSGGLAVIPLIMNRYFKLSVSTTNFVANTIVVLMGWYFYGFNMVLYAIMLLMVSSYICNMVILGVSRNKVMFINSDKYKEIIKLFHDKYHQTVTIINSKGNDIIIAVINNIDYSFVRKDLKLVDNKVFFTTNDCYELKK